MKYTGFGISIRLVCRNYTFDRVYVDLSILRVLGFLEGAYMQDLFFGNALGDASAHTKPAYLHASLSSLSRMKLTDMVSIRNVSTSSGTDLKELHVIMWLRGPPLRMHRWAVGGGRTISSVLAELHGVHEERHRVDLGERYVHSFGLW